MTKRQEKKRTSMKFLVVLVMLFCMAILYLTAGEKKKRDEKLLAKAQIEAQIAEQQEESQKLDAKQNYTKTWKFVEEMARKVLGLVYPDEIIFEEDEK